MTAPVKIDPRVRIGHVHLRVSDLETAMDFYCDVLGLELTQRVGDQAAFLAVAGYHHHIALHSVGRETGFPQGWCMGKGHFSLLFPSRTALIEAVRRLVAAGVRVDACVDHGVCESVYIRDPDGNHIELCRDRTRDSWPLDEQGVLAMTHESFELDELLET